jgi:hypothetical protein
MSVMERKIDDLLLRIEGDTIALYDHGRGDILLIRTKPEGADALAAALTELAADLRQDLEGRTWSRQIMEGQTS